MRRVEAGEMSDVRMQARDSKIRRGKQRDEERREQVVGPSTDGLDPDSTRVQEQVLLCSTMFGRCMDVG
eukprot:746766-Hanusia_phi.AAC.3